ncbi:2-oxo acid dehydrogenase subunit E2 [Rhodococcus fascians]|uniref:2-oxo acid dehydrogenase subunit E2 n=1 Tax=Rhodococcoides fascians TaxID=1828 RepID=UPI00195F1567|nr:2-oxo acid dehydrogenase subunit E2 [Rhodococcus fascians]MBM7242558.1 2-oxo acid dehydrogenase subunit E2 [Rhodococcus fascians]MBY3811986.1 2-oxo acid dehydrogenase subunit E2 [Rhodococcus fascians]MBY3840706.1 2-oxo acid dehydrogenase subunit E2 [Rhodococcus fascians]MBY3848162.1 2-oxo acid dehydrogenase subunit E2 [Rhodococcus fascians]MBY3853283.1 2-oxo acid dehydrogenase subunit E2 [Rhodococcus fascians]
MTTTETSIVILMPPLGENVTEGTVTRWLKQPGDFVDVDEALLEVATDKVDTEIPSPVAGTLTSVIAQEDDVVEIGESLATITPTDTGSTPTDSATDEPSPAPMIAPPARIEAAQPEQRSQRHDEQSASAATSSNSAPTTAHPAPTAADARAQPPHTPGQTKPQQTTDTASGDSTASGARIEKLPRIRRTIAARMVESLQTAAQLTTVVEVDLSAIAHLRNEHKATFFDRTGHKLSYLPFFAKAAVEALSANEVINSSLNTDVTEVTYHRACHLGMAVDSEKGLMVPVLRDADTLTVAGLAQEIATAADRVRTGKIGPDELTGGTFTITNTGSRGALFDTPIINQPQSAILGTGSVVERLTPSRDPEGNLTIFVKPYVFLALSYDHRIVDGADAARYLSDVKQRLEEGYTSTDLQ